MTDILLPAHRATARDERRHSRNTPAHQGIQGFHRGQQGRPVGGARIDPRAHRSERRRQDDLLQPAHQVPRADHRHDPVQRAGHHRRAARADRAARHHPLVPDLGGVPAPHAARERAAGPAARAGHLVPLLEEREVAQAVGCPRPRAAGRSRPRRPRRRTDREPALRPQARARDRDHARNGARADAARRTHAGHGPRGRAPRGRTHQARVGRPHHPDGRAQHERGLDHRRHHHGAAARRRAGRRPVRRGLEATRR